MYGTIARMRLTDGAEQQLEQFIAESVGAGVVPGMIGEYIYRSDSDPRAYWIAVVFESREAYRKNAESPEQHRQYERYRALLEADPEWHDGEIVAVVPAR